jgi:hypothetical protein
MRLEDERGKMQGDLICNYCWMRWTDMDKRPRTTQEGDTMSIELKQAAQQALDAFEAFGEADDFATLFTLTQKMNVLRTATQQAESEPVAWMASYVDPIGNDHVYVTSHHDLAVENDMHGTPTPLYTHPAPGVPEKLTVDPSGVSGTADEGYVAGWNACRDEMLTAAPDAERW